MKEKIVYYVALNLPDWMTNDDKNMCVRQVDGREDVLSPEGEDVFLVTDEHKEKLDYRHILQFRLWIDKGGPRWDPSLGGINLKRGKLMMVATDSDVLSGTIPEQPQWKK